MRKETNVNWEKIIAKTEGDELDEDRDVREQVERDGSTVVRGETWVSVSWERRRTSLEKITAKMREMISSKMKTCRAEGNDVLKMMTWAISVDFSLRGETRVSEILTTSKVKSSSLSSTLHLLLH